MFTITTNKDEVAGIVSGEVKQKALPLSDYYESRIVKLIPDAGQDRREIIKNLRDGKVAANTECQVCFTAGGAARVTVWATFSIGRINPDAAETFILTIVDVVEAAGLEAVGGAIAERVDGEVLDDTPSEGMVGGNMANAPAIQTTSKHTGFCRFCNQARMIEAPDGLSGDDYNDYATADCDCNEAQQERQRRAKMEAAGQWAKNMFSQSDGQLQLVLCAIRATFDGNVDYATIKIGKHTHKVDRDGDGMIRIRTVFRDSNEETF